MDATSLLKALRLVGKPVCRKAADELMATVSNRAPHVVTKIELHLRQADLTPEDALTLSKGMKLAASTADDSTAVPVILHSFSAR